MEEVSGKHHKASTHSGLVRVDVDAVEVDVAIVDVDASALRAEQWSVSPSGRWNVTGSGLWRKGTHILPVEQERSVHAKRET